MSKPTSPFQARILNELKAKGVKVPDEAFASYQKAYQIIGLHRNGANGGNAAKRAGSGDSKDSRNTIQRSLDYWKLALRYDRFADLEDATPDQVFTVGEFEAALASAATAAGESEPVFVTIGVVRQVLQTPRNGKPDFKAWHDVFIPLAGLSGRRISSETEFRYQPEYRPMLRCNRGFLEPLPFDRDIVLGATDELEALQEKHFSDLPDDPAFTDVWQRARSLLNELADYDLAGAPPSAWNCRETRVLVYPLAKDKTSPSKTEHLYNYLQGVAADQKNVPRLFSRLFGEPNRGDRKLDSEGAAAASAKNLGHMDTRGQPNRPLDPSQRDAVWHTLGCPTGELCAVNGPPGTGKTTLMKSLVASLFVERTTNGSEMPDPPLIVACAATNKAATNVITGFGDVGPTGTGATWNHRWFSGPTSYGWFAPAMSQLTEKKRAEWTGYQLLASDFAISTSKFPFPEARDGQPVRGSAFKMIGAASAIDQLNREVAISEYLQNANLVLAMEDISHRPLTSVEECCRRLRQRALRLREEIGLLTQAIFELVSPAVVDALQLPDQAAAIEAAKRSESAWLSAQSAAEQEKDDLLTRLRGVNRHVQSLVRCAEAAAVLKNGSWWKRATTLRWWRLRFGAEAPRLIAEANAQAEDALAWIHELDSAANVGERLKDEAGTVSAAANDAARRMREARDEASRQRATRTDLEQVQGRRQRALARLDELRHDVELWRASAGSASERLLAFVDGVVRGRASASEAAGQINDFLDVTLRTKLFHVCARYWEGRWLIACGTDRPENTPANEWDLRLASMLGPCIVATAHNLPALFTRFNGTQERFTEFKLGRADMLIVDEAGQLPPELGVGAFAFAERAIVVGDTEQLAPIAAVTKPEDSALGKQVGFKDAEPARIVELGFSASRGSIMRVAQSYSCFSAPALERGELPRGLWLLNHYRCFEQIGRFFHEFVYRERLHFPLGGPAREMLIPPMSWVAVDGSPDRGSGGKSWCNAHEATEIAEWLHSARSEIISEYGAGRKGLEDLVAIITPFAAQAELVKSAMKKRFADAPLDWDRFIIGTVHALQGAEKPVILFSLVSGPDDEGGTTFFDRDKTMVNVAVSRAKCAFVLFAPRAALKANPGKSLKDPTVPPSQALAIYLARHGRQLRPQYIVIVESPTKAKIVKDALGWRVECLPTGGHFRDLPDFKVDPWSPADPPRWNLDASKKEFIDAISRECATARELVIATDADNEGEAIAWHLLDYLQQHSREPLTDKMRISRMRFHSLDSDALKSAFALRGPGLDIQRVKAALTRRVIDYVVGHRYAQRIGSPVWGLSRVQTGALFVLRRMLRERAQEADRRGFKVKVRVGDALFDGYSAKEVALGERPASIEAATIEHHYYSPPPASNTLEILCAALALHNLQPARTMAVMEELYLGKPMGGANGRR